MTHTARPRARLSRVVTALIATAMLSTPFAAMHAQSGTVTFGGQTNSNGALPTASYSGPALTFSSAVRAGFGNTATVGTADARWWTGAYSGQGMVYGNNSTLGNVLELTFDAGSGFNLLLSGSLFGGWPDRERHVTYQLFNEDYTLSTAVSTVLTGTNTPAAPTFAANNWGRIVRLQFTETDANGVNAGRGAFDVGVQGIGYTVSDANEPPPVSVPEPSTYVLMASGLLGLLLTTRRRSCGA